MGSSCQKQSDFSINHRISEGKSKLKDLKFIRVIKRNKISTVWLVQSKKQKTFSALKVISKAYIVKLNCIYLPINEQNVLSKLQSPFITNCSSTFQDSKNLYFLLDYMPMGNLRDYLEYHTILTQKQARFLVLCILNALDYLNMNGIIHLDIKPQNIVIDQKGYFRLCDFNLSRILKNKKFIENHGGTYGYQAPQSLSGNNKVSYCTDYYSLGIVLFECLSNQNPKNFQISQENVHLYFKNKKNISPQCVEFITALIKHDPEERLGSKTIYDIWQHPWLAIQIYQKKQHENKTVDSPISKKYRQYCERKSLSHSNKNTDDQLDESDSGSFDKTIHELKINDIKFQRKFQKFKVMERKLTF